jgi:hypothetical protein
VNGVFVSQQKEVATMLYNAAIQLYVMLLKAFACGWNAEHRLEELKNEIPAASRELVLLNYLIGEAEKNPEKFYVERIGGRFGVFNQATFDSVLTNLLRDRQATSGRVETLTRERRWIKRFNKALAQSGDNARHLAH